MEKYDVIVVGDGPAGLSAGIFCSRNGLKTAIIDDDKSILHRNAHLENFLGFPAGVNSRLFLEMGRDQAERNGSEYVEERVSEVVKKSDFKAETDDGSEFSSEYVIVATKNETSFLEGLGLETREANGKKFIVTDSDGSTNIDKLYAAGGSLEKDMKLS